MRYKSSFVLNPSGHDQKRGARRRNYLSLRKRGGAAANSVQNKNDLTHARDALRRVNASFVTYYFTAAYIARTMNKGIQLVIKAN